MIHITSQQGQYHYVHVEYLAGDKTGGLGGEKHRCAYQFFRVPSAPCGFAGFYPSVKPRVFHQGAIPSSFIGEQMLMIFPSRREIVSRMTCCVVRKTPVRLISRTSRHTASSMSTIGARCWTPALFTSMVIEPTSSSIFFTYVFIWCFFVTSNANGSFPCARPRMPLWPVFVSM